MKALKKVTVYIIVFSVALTSAIFAKKYIDSKNHEENYGEPLGYLEIGGTLTKYDYEAVILKVTDNKIICKAEKDYINENYGGRYSHLDKGTLMVLFADEGDGFSADGLKNGDKIRFTTTGPNDMDSDGRLVMNYSEVNSGDK